MFVFIKGWFFWDINLSRKWCWEFSHAHNILLIFFLTLNGKGLWRHPIKPKADISHVKVIYQEHKNRWIISRRIRFHLNGCKDFVFLKREEDGTSIYWDILNNPIVSSIVRKMIWKHNINISFHIFNGTFDLLCNDELWLSMEQMNNANFCYT